VVASQRLHLGQLAVELGCLLVVALAEGPVRPALDGGDGEEARKDYKDAGDGHPGDHHPPLTVLLDQKEAQCHQRQRAEG
jgi:hypothetical protein